MIFQNQIELAKASPVMADRQSPGGTEAVITAPEFIQLEPIVSWRLSHQ